MRDGAIKETHPSFVMHEATTRFLDRFRTPTQGSPSAQREQNPVSPTPTAARETTAQENGSCPHHPHAQQQPPTAAEGRVPTPVPAFPRSPARARLEADLSAGDSDWAHSRPWPRPHPQHSGDEGPPPANHRVATPTGPDNTPRTTTSGRESDSATKAAAAPEGIEQAPAAGAASGPPPAVPAPKTMAVAMANEPAPASAQALETPSLAAGARSPPLPVTPIGMAARAAQAARAARAQAQHAPKPRRLALPPRQAAAGSIPSLTLPLPHVTETTRSPLPLQQQRQQQQHTPRIPAAPSYPKPTCVAPGHKPPHEQTARPPPLPALHLPLPPPPEWPSMPYLAAAGPTPTGSVGLSSKDHAAATSIPDCGLEARVPDAMPSPRPGTPAAKSLFANAAAPPTGPATQSERCPPSPRAPPPPNATAAAAAMLHQPQSSVSYMQQPLPQRHPPFFGSASPPQSPRSAELDLSKLVVDFNDPTKRLSADALGDLFRGEYYRAPVAVRRVRLPVAPAAGDQEELARQRNVLARFANSIREYECVNHPCIARFMGVAAPENSVSDNTHPSNTVRQMDPRLENPPCALIVSESMDGGNLKGAIDVLRSAPSRPQNIDLYTLVGIAAQVASGLTALHCKALVHGDLTPSNIYLGHEPDKHTGALPRNCAAKISDFGLKFPDEFLLNTTASSIGASMVGAIQYKAPEAMTPTESSLNMAKAGDIFSLGVILYEMLTMVRPWFRCDMFYVFNAVAKRRERPAWPNAGRQVPQSLRDLVERMWSHDPMERPDAATIHSELRALQPALSLDIRMSNELALRSSDNSEICAVETPDLSSDRVFGCSSERSERSLDCFFQQSPIDRSGDVATQLVSSMVPENSASSESSAPEAEHLTCSVGLDVDQECSRKHVLTPVDAVVNNDHDRDVSCRRNCEFSTVKASVSSCRPVPGVLSPLTTETDTDGKSLTRLGKAIPIASQSIYETTLISSFQDQFFCPGRSYEDNLKRSSSGIHVVPSDTSVCDSEYRKLLGASTVSMEVTEVEPRASEVLDADHTSEDRCSAERNRRISIEQVPLPQPGTAPLQENADSNSEPCSMSRSLQPSDDPPTELPSTRPLTNSGLTESARWNFAKGTVADLIAAAAYRHDKASQNLEDEDPVITSKLSLVSERVNVDSTLKDAKNGHWSAPPPDGSTIRRKRSKILQELIEESGLALLELQRRGQLESLPPQRRRRKAAAADAAQEAALKEQEFVRAIIKAQAEYDHACILAVMRSLPESLAVARAGLAALCCVAESETVFFDACEEGAIDELVASTSRHEKDPEVCALFCQAIMLFVSWYDDRVGHLVRAVGAPAAVINVMSDHKGNIDVQTKGCRAIASICSASELNRNACVTLGGPLVLYKAMTRNLTVFKDPTMAKSSLDAFRRIADKNPEAATALLQVCAIDAVCRCAEIFAMDGIDEDILAALEAVASHTEGRDLIIRSNGMKAVATIMNRMNDPEFLRRCCRFVVTVCLLRVSACEDEMLLSGIVEQVVRSLRIAENRGGSTAMPFGAPLVFEAAQALAFMASFGSYLQDRCRLVHAVHAVRDALYAHGANPYCAKLCARAVIRLCENNAVSIRHAEQNGICAALLKALEVQSARRNRKDGNPEGLRDAVFEIKLALKLFDGAEQFSGKDRRRFKPGRASVKGPADGQGGPSLDSDPSSEANAGDQPMLNGPQGRRNSSAAPGRQSAAGQSTDDAVGVSGRRASAVGGAVDATQRKRWGPKPPQSGASPSWQMLALHRFTHGSK